MEIHGGVLPELLHILNHFRCRCVPVLGIQGHAFQDDLFQAHRDIGV